MYASLLKILAMGGTIDRYLTSSPATNGANITTYAWTVPPSPFLLTEFTGDVHGRDYSIVTSLDDRQCAGTKPGGSLAKADPTQRKQPEPAFCTLGQRPSEVRRRLEKLAVPVVQSKLGLRVLYSFAVPIPRGNRNRRPPPPRLTDQTRLRAEIYLTF
jgi:hypothetical protein